MSSTALTSLHQLSSIVAAGQGKIDGIQVSTSRLKNLYPGVDDLYLVSKEIKNTYVPWLIQQENIKKNSKSILYTPSGTASLVVDALYLEDGEVAIFGHLPIFVNFR